MTEASKKVDGGKLVKVRVDRDGVRILGDFFVHPEEEIDGLESVVEEYVDEEPEEIADAVEGFLREEGVELLGFSARDVAETAVKARDEHRRGEQ